jgi:catechol 2,3-dioxygenase-like lactoylglutathione lyase family enzyme
MIIGVVQTALVVREYDEAKEFYCGKLGFTVVEDAPAPGGKRWVRLRAPGGAGCDLLLSRAANDAQRLAVGNQTGGRVLYFMHTDDFDGDYERLRGMGVQFVEGPRDEAFGRVGVFLDLYGNRIDLIGPHR